jgi:predicted DNA-binding WGR domain protein
MNRREFQLVEGSSSKFWVIEFRGSSFTVTWGRIGTNGQTQSKEFGSDAEAAKQCEKLVAEKLKKGYGEVGGGNGAAPTTTAATAKSTAPKVAKPATARASKPDPEQGSPAATDSRNATPPSAAPVSTDVTRSIDLAPADWLTATWRPYTPAPRPAAQPFDRDVSAARVAKVSVNTYGWKWDWATAGIPPAMTPEEAHFWLAAMRNPRPRTGPPRPRPRRR